MIAALEEVAVYAPADESLTVTNVKRLKRDINQLAGPGARVLIDLSRVQWMDSAVCGALLWAYRMIHENGGELKLCAATPTVRALFELVRLHRVVDVFNTREEGIRSFGV